MSTYYLTPVGMICICTGMGTHAHAAAIDRIGSDRIKSHFNFSRQVVNRWRYAGVPRMHRETLRLLAIIKGVQVPELNEEVAGA